MDGSAAEVGRSLLREVEEVDLNEILQSIRNKASTQVHLNVPAIDKIAKTFVQHKTAHTPLVTELASTTPAAGKTNLLYYLISQAILPYRDDDDLERSQIPGMVVIFDADNRFDVDRLVQVMSTNHGYETLGVRPEIRAALRHIHIFRPQSLATLSTAISNLEAYLFDFNQHHSAHRPVNLIVIDSVTAFVWPERWSKELKDLDRLDAIPGSHDCEVEASPYAELVSALKCLQKSFRCPVVATSILSPNAKPVLPAVWQQYVTFRLKLGRVSVKKFPAHYTLDQAMADKAQRQEIVDQGEFGAHVDMEANVAWSQSLEDALKSNVHLRKFGFVINDQGVILYD